VPFWNQPARYDILIINETSDMKTRFWAIAGLAGLTAAIYYFRFRRKTEGVRTYKNIKKQIAYGEKHIRSVMNKSKHVL
jgi:LPXTG-motif cell wall-anchored protein